MNRDEELQRLIEDRDDKESKVDHIYDQIRLGHANEDEEDSYINELQNAIMYLDHCIEELQQS